MYGRVHLPAVAIVLAIATGCGGHAQSRPPAIDCDTTSLSLAIAYWGDVVATDMRTASAAKTDGDSNLAFDGRSLADSATQAETAIRAAATCGGESRRRQQRWVTAMRGWRNVGRLIAGGASDYDVESAIQAAKAATPK